MMNGYDVDVYWKKMKRVSVELQLLWHGRRAFIRTTSCGSSVLTRKRGLPLLYPRDAIHHRPSKQAPGGQAKRESVIVVQHTCLDGWCKLVCSVMHIGTFGRPNPNIAFNVLTAFNV